MAWTAPGMGTPPAPWAASPGPDSPSHEEIVLHVQTGTPLARMGTVSSRTFPPMLYLLNHCAFTNLAAAAQLRSCARCGTAVCAQPFLSHRAQCLTQLQGQEFLFCNCSCDLWFDLLFYWFCSLIMRQSCDVCSKVRASRVEETWEWVRSDFPVFRHTEVQHCSFGINGDGKLHFLQWSILIPHGAPLCPALLTFDKGEWTLQRVLREH